MTDDFDALFSNHKRPQKSFAERMGYAPDHTAEEPQATAHDSIYKPYGSFTSGSIGEVCDVRRWIDGTTIGEGIEFQYRFLMQVGYVNDTELRLFLPDSIVLIEGKKLTELRTKLGRRTVTFIQQYNPRIWPAGANGEPLIERIEIIRPEKSRSAL